MPKAVIFDLNGVFIQSKPLSERINEDYNVPVPEFMVVLSDVMKQVRVPEAPGVYELFAPHLKRWNIAMDKRQFLAYWFEAESENDKMVSLAAELKREGFRVFVLSNNFRERTEYYAAHFPFLLDLDHTYYSWQTGNVKPSPQCYEQILEENDISPNDCYYFDDSEKNVAAARELGIWAYRFEGAEQVEKLLQRQ